MNAVWPAGGGGHRRVSSPAARQENHGAAPTSCSGSKRRSLNSLKNCLDRWVHFILRDVKFKSTVRMSPKLLDLLYLIQVWLRINRLPYKILVNSGYRTPQHNSKLEGAAKQSLHIKAMAADIRIPGLSVDNLGKLAQAIGVGGVGFYPTKGFIHVDVGKVRTWRVAESTVLEPEYWIVELLDPSTDAQWLANLAPDWPELEMLA
ncbi:YcbK family protein [Pseudomonas aeruginosa]|uniref:YcbK family protein n=7 Tax=Pseudomonas aeruginosa TaxID=287 RepID=UPI003D9C68B0